MQDFLNFNSFVAQDVLILFYYAFALLMPIVIWKSRFYLVKKFSFLQKIDADMQGMYRDLSLEQKVNIILTFTVLFLCMELCLRMAFEAMVAYFNMHDYLYEISQELQKK